MPQRALVQFVAILQQPRHRDDKPRRAEAALRTVALDHRLLHGTRRRTRVAEAFDRDDVRAIELEHELDARIDRPINQPVDGAGVFCDWWLCHVAMLSSRKRVPTPLAATQPPDEDAARAAIPLAAHDLRAHQALHAAEEIGQGQKGIRATHFVAAAVHV